MAQQASPDALNYMGCLYQQFFTLDDEAEAQGRVFNDFPELRSTETDGVALVAQTEAALQAFFASDLYDDPNLADIDVVAPLPSDDYEDYRNQLIAVAGLYQAALGRYPDYGGLQFWVTQLKNTEFPLVLLTELAAEFNGSAEFAALYGDISNDEDYVRLLFENALGRDPEAVAQEDIDFWLNQGLSNDELLVAFAVVPELAIQIARDLPALMSYLSLETDSTPSQTDIQTAIDNYGTDSAGLVTGVVGEVTATASYPNSTCGSLLDFTPVVEGDIVATLNYIEPATLLTFGGNYRLEVSVRYTGEEAFNLTPLVGALTISTENGEELTLSDFFYEILDEEGTPRSLNPSEQTSTGFDVLYLFEGPEGAWDTGDNGTYTLDLTNGIAAATDPLATFEVAIVSDPVAAPISAVLQPIPAIITESEPVIDIVVTYNAPGLDEDSLGNDDLFIDGPGVDADLPVVFVSSQAISGSQIEATYQLQSTPGADGWGNGPGTDDGDEEDNGTYMILLQEGALIAGGQAVPGEIQDLGQFIVSIHTAGSNVSPRLTDISIPTPVSGTPAVGMTGVDEDDKGIFGGNMGGGRLDRNGP
ncbi:MAG: DUF4214 domain-containing protein, partial [Candidatus Competibacterales bacterium]